MKIVVFLLSLFLLLQVCTSAVMAQTHKPSFNCQGKLSVNERLICSNGVLANMDVDISRNFHELTALLNRGAADIVRSDQKSWLGQRQSCGADFQCTNAIMHNRLSDLSQQLLTQQNFRKGIVQTPTNGLPPGSKTNCSVFNMVQFQGECVSKCPDGMVSGSDSICRQNDEADNPNPCGPAFYLIRGRCISAADVHENTSFCGAGAVLINQQCFTDADIQFRP